MQVDARTVKKHFEKSMVDYDDNALVQRIIAENLVEELSKIKKYFPSVLELGSGTGLLTRVFSSKCKFDSYTANDLTERGKFYLDKILPPYDFICGNAEKIKTNSSFDLIISNAMFQWFSDLENAVCKHFYSKLKAGGVLAFTTFSNDNFKEVRSITGLSLEYKSFDEISEIISKKYEIIYSKNFDYVMKFKTPLELLAHMKHTGVNSLGVKKWSIVQVKDFCEKYRNLYPEISLTYSPVIFIVQKK